MEELVIQNLGVRQEARLPELVPEILAPAGGRSQFFAALHAGADAVYLGLKEFNARGRAENFTLDDLRELVPLAHAHGMKVLVTLNIILKEAELPRLTSDLIQLEWIGVDAVIVQDLGVARLIRTRFPGLRLHASTQLAVHNVQGVRAAAALGFKRVVLARELTAQELRLIRQKVSPEEVEIEVFCHGSLCYSYSGLCFFSGAADARSGNRGECAYTCRKPYKVLNEPGHGFLFSMKDLDTSAALDKLVTAGVDTLKIEGRKKDAQYVATVVGVYRQQLDRIFQRNTAPKGRSVARDFGADMSFSYHRDVTSFFVKGRYHENVIDLGNPTHKGLFIGKVGAVHGNLIEVKTNAPLERFDGIRIDREGALYHAKPQHGESSSNDLQAAREKYANEVCQFSLRDFTVGGRRAFAAASGDVLAMTIPDNLPRPKAGDLVFKVRSNELKRHTEALSVPPKDYRLQPTHHIDLKIHVSGNGCGIVCDMTASLANQFLAVTTCELKAERPRSQPRLSEDLNSELQILGDLGLSCRIEVSGDLEWFVPRSQIKQAKKHLIKVLMPAVEAWNIAKTSAVQDQLRECRGPLLSRRQPKYSIKCDRMETLRGMLDLQTETSLPAIDEIVFEPKRAFLQLKSPGEILGEILTIAAALRATFRLAIPTVLRAWDEPFLKPWLQAMKDHGQKAFEVGNIGAFSLLAENGFKPEDCDLASDFTLYVLNTEAVRQVAELGCRKMALSIEDDRSSLRDKLTGWPKLDVEPQVILYKDTPLFIAEACSLTALHKGCPTAKVCGYRTLEIENDEGERFFVAHESCKSIVYGAEAYAISQYQDELLHMGVNRFRIDFLTRPYELSEIRSILAHCMTGRSIPGSHGANYTRSLL